MADNKVKLDDFYEDAGDPLALFRAVNGGGFIESEGNVPFSKDVDVMQSERQEKLETDTRDMGF